MPRPTRERSTWPRAPLGARSMFNGDANAFDVIPVFMRLTHSIPIVLPTASDPVGVGYAQSLARPGGNVTGFRHSQKRQPRKQLRSASLTWADVRRSSGIKPRAAGIAGGSADRRLRRVRDREWRSAASNYSLKLLHFARRERSITFAMPSMALTT